MDQARFEQMVARLETESAQRPNLYQFKVGLLALLGFGVLGLIVSIAGFGLLLIVGVTLSILFSGGKAAILLLKLGKILFFLAIPLWLLVKSSLSALFTRLPKPTGKELTRPQAPALFKAMDQMRQRMQGPRFHHVLITDDMNASVFQRPAWGLFGWPRNYLILGLPLLESLPPEEALAVVAHEYGHLAGSHSKFGAYIYRLRHTWGTISGIADQWKGWSGRQLQKVIRWYAPYFNAYTFVLARANEYQADAAAAELVSAPVAANALKRVNVSASHQAFFFEQTFERVGEQPTPPENIAEQWAHQATEPIDDEMTHQWLNQALSRASTVSDTHPALTQRLQALNLTAEELRVVPLAPTGQTAASAWLGPQLPAIRQEMQSAWATRVAEPWSERHGLIQKQRQRLSELSTQAELNVDEQCEHLQLKLRLDKASDHLPALSVFNQIHPDHALGLYLEADWRLDHDDETGLALLERVMSLDPSATKAACETAWRYWIKKGDEDLARPYQARWNERHEWEVEKERQLSDLSLSHTLASASDLSADEIRAIHTNVQKARKGIKRAYLARRVLPIDPAEPTYVVAIELTAWARWRKHGPQVVQALLAMDWPRHTFVCAMTHELRPLKKKIEAVPQSSIPL